MKVRVQVVEDITFVGETGSGHAVVMDAAPEVGGRDLGPRPMEMMLLGMGGCSAIDVISILKKGRHAVEDCVIEIEGERRDELPKIFTKIHAHYVVKGNNLPANAVDRAIKLSAEIYCSATAILAATAKITHDFEIVETAAA